jgi:hypothetical protein
VVIVLLSTLQVLLRAKSNNHFDTEEKLPLFEAIYGLPIENEIITNMDVFKNRVTNMLAVSCSLKPMPKTDLKFRIFEVSDSR